jgi:hypothetical protein
MTESVRDYMVRARATPLGRFTATQRYDLVRDLIPEPDEVFDEFLVGVRTDGRVAIRWDGPLQGDTWFPETLALLVEHCFRVLCHAGQGRPTDHYRAAWASIRALWARLSGDADRVDLLQVVVWAFTSVRDSVDRAAPDILSRPAQACALLGSAVRRGMWRSRMVARECVFAVGDMRDVLSRIIRDQLENT